MYARERLRKNVVIMGFDENTGPRIKQSGNFFDVTQKLLELNREDRILK